MKERKIWPLAFYLARGTSGEWGERGFTLFFTHVLFLSLSLYVIVSLSLYVIVSLSLYVTVSLSLYVTLSLSLLLSVSLVLRRETVFGFFHSQNYNEKFKVSFTREGERARERDPKLTQWLWNNNNNNNNKCCCYCGYDQYWKTYLM